MNDVISAAWQSVKNEWIKHGVNTGAGVTGQFVLPDWFTVLGAVVTLSVSCMIGFKTYKEIQVVRIEEKRARIALAHESKRSSDKV